MSTIKDGGPAFPHPDGYLNGNGYWVVHENTGMSLRDYCAIQALTGILSTETPGQESPSAGIAKYAYELADAMLKAREVQS